MTLVSPLDRLAFLYADEPHVFVSSLVRTQEYNGTLEGVIDELDKILVTERIDANALLTIAQDSARVIRAALDAGEYREEATELALAVYQRHPDARALLHAFREKAGVFPVLQRPDQFAAQYTHTCYTRTTIESLELLAKQSPVLFIALGHGGILPGMDVFTHYVDNTQTDSVFYPVRYSTRKKMDTRPQLDDYTAVQKYAHGREIVIFDEDLCSGATMGGAYSFFAQKVFSHHPIILLTNDALTNEKGLAKRQNTSGFPDFAEFYEQSEALELMAELDPNSITNGMVAYLHLLSKRDDVDSRISHYARNMLKSYETHEDFQGFFD